MRLWIVEYFGACSLVFEARHNYIFLTEDNEMLRKWQCNIIQEIHVASKIVSLIMTFEEEGKNEVRKEGRYQTLIRRCDISTTRSEE